MKKLLILTSAICAAACIIPAGGRVVNAEETEINCKSAYLCDFSSGTVVYAKNETEELPIASMCKIMTLLLSFEAVDAGNLSYDEMITVSERAAGMGGSQVFLQENLQYRADELMKTVAVCSANDSCVALAERIAGSESAFVDAMNARAKALGADHTLFANCTGLPKEPQYSCAKDVALMLREMVSHKKYFEFSKVWLEDFAHPDGRTTTITNTNKLIRFYEGCDGGKTGFTNQAGFCLAATAKRGDTRLVSVVIGADSSKNRFESTKFMFNDAFNRYETAKIFEAGASIDTQAQVTGSAKTAISVQAETDLNVFCPKGDAKNLMTEIRIHENLRAPIEMGTVIGEAIVYREGVEVSRCNLIAGENADKYGWWDAFKKGAQLWN